ncbi:MAG TPA: cupredoxin family copper-binding protein [Solirubrobacterales bacterium]|nr:cupredoxin family copper-binding protein [Solirubrobacterales bacterium]
MGSTRPPVGVALFLLAAIAAALVGCGGSGGGADRSSASGDGAQGTKAVMIRDYEYEPASITVPVGTTVTFTNRDTTPHTATSKQSGAFESGSIDTGRSGKVTLEQAGTFAYYCLFHPFMKGTIVVE